MSAEEVLRSSEDAAMVEGDQFVSHVKNQQSRGKRGKLKAATAGGFITIILGVVMLFFLSGNLIPAAVSERLIEETDIQYADAVESKLLVFQQALYSHDVPENTIMRLANAGVEVVEGENGTLALVYNGQTIAAKNFITAVKSDAGLYAAFNEATYGRAAYWYDKEATRIIQEIGTSRNNYTYESDFGEVMSQLTGEGSNINVNNVVLTTRQTEDGETETVYETVGGNTQSSAAAEFVAAVQSKNVASSSVTATLNAADTLNKSDIMAKEQKSAIFFLAFMENISKMKAGEGNEAKVNEAMGVLFETRTSQVVDVATGEVVTVEGSMVESPSLYAVLSGERVDVGAVTNYASDRVLRTVENRVGATAGAETLAGTITSTAAKIKGTIGRFVMGSETASLEALSSVTPTIDGSLVNNGFSEINGIPGGEMMVEGAINVGKALARASGATTGDAAAAKAYARATSEILALDAEADRLSRSPFDITSRNTFLGSIVYRLAVMTSRNSGVVGVAKSLAQVAGGALKSLAGVALAEDGEEGILTSFGDCQTLGAIGVVGSAGCASVMTFDTSTLNDTFNDAGFVKFVEDNTVLEWGVRRIKNNSVLADFIKYNDERKTSDGVMDGGILQALSSGGISIPFVSDIIAMVKLWLGTSETEKAIASGAEYANSASNPNWENYKYAQRYVSLARATDVLREYDGGTTAYNSLRFFEGTESPVVAFIRDYYNLANK